MLEIGSVIEGKYKILNRIGQGGMSVVYLAMNERANKQWAIKEVRKDGTHNFEVVRQGLIVETEMLKKLSHPYLPSIVDVVDGDGSFLIVMDYIEGNTLARNLEDDGAQSQKDVIEWAKQLCDVLGYLHSCNPPIIYRDLKPSNIMLKPGGTISLIDFGTAREYKARNVADTTCLGTQGYAAPEQFGGMGQTDARTDIYSLGATMYHLVTGHNPCEPPYEIRPIREWDPGLSQGLEKIIKKCTAKNPDDRFQSCEEVLYALKHYDELDNRHIRKQKKKLGVFCVSLCLFLLFSIAACMTGASAKQISTGNYEYFLEEAKSQPTKEAKLDNYLMAMQLEPGNEQAYIEFLEKVLLEDDIFSAEEDTIMRSVLIKDSDGMTYEEILRENTEGYARFAYKMGIAYFYSYEEKGNKTLAVKWLDIAARADKLEESQRLRAECLSRIAGYYTKIGKESKSGDANISYADYWRDMTEVAQGNIAQIDNSTTALIVYRELSTQICINAVSFKNAGVSQQEMEAQLENIRKRLETDIEVTDISGLERIMKLKEQVEESMEYAQQAVTIAFGTRVE
ncbi:MAG: serine/threonine-protein kinase [Lachnospiraceae bacterium]|nr:serine/threonine-protein kinase [Lachnospiraceae bacterium]